ncbi:precorrin-2 dehydrogenase/sirohydrochlorin ferrochelatase family protein [Sphingomonas sp.]|jgi:uroporphyrin-III C-methyltransferase/precorrin-2 dehydrogenase/sirohydrochlorin ferrochelatase|uniref:precorrin-2 dehydrogenase/sirohydrochlorin ferrochelatase family protein n=1 Tax=Sphingomonas sp. TaxID=28214 RepID=UPI002ED9726C
MSLAALPIYVRLDGRAVILAGEGEAADAKRRLLERAGAVIVDPSQQAALAIVALDDPEAMATELRGRGILVNTVDRPDLCDFMLPAIVDRDPVLVAIGTGGASAGLAAAVRQKLETMLPATLGRTARELYAARPAIRARWPDMASRRRAIGAALDMLDGDVVARVLDGAAAETSLLRFTLASSDPDDLTLRQARALGGADRVYHRADVPAAILDRARADAARIRCDCAPDSQEPGLSLYLEMAK